MKTIWKFPLEIADFQNIEMPKGAEVLTVQVQNKQPCLWAKVSPVADKEPRGFWIRGTGHPMDYEKHIGEYVGTFQIHDGALVFHVFEHRY